METTDVQCPSCHQVFSVPVPPPDEQPCELDYDCEICCRPMILRFSDDFADTCGLGD